MIFLNEALDRVWSFIPFKANNKELPSQLSSRAKGPTYLPNLPIKNLPH